MSARIYVPDIGLNLLGLRCEIGEELNQFLAFSDKARHRVRAVVFREVFHSHTMANYIRLVNNLIW